MSDDLEQPAQVADSAAAQAAPASEVTSQVPDAGVPADGAPETPVDDQAALASLLPDDDGMEEIEHEGLKAKVPKELKEAFMRHRDYTQKTQEVADLRRQAEAQAAEVQRQAQFHQQHLAEVARVVSIDSQLSEYQKVDWQTLIAQNPQQALSLDRQMRELQGQRAELVQGLTQKQQQQALMEQQETARRIQDGQRELQRDIKGWSPELATKLTEYSKKLGFPSEVIARVTQPAFVKAIHKAYLYDQLVAQRSAKPPAPPAQPVSRVGARASTAVVDMDKLPADEWRKAREAQLEARRKKR
jgi:Asp-tRNA(Asn)/Glu-tRNA(Gln) amidotransferase A subunit family amidase